MKSRQLVEERPLRGEIYITLSKAVAHRQRRFGRALEKMGYEVAQVKPKGATTTFAEARQELANRTGHEPK
ncbi:hypothetical protein ELS82_20435 [Vibrio ouci]|uniref:Uncharacterized protein n=1 Tax=Vibrio ouci TaxID=2499078 RepID=A0A4Y8WAW0_9VIBR|nr:hypothetical protein [Vibrio ouci]TFH89786.1 hypothetical protein ELS82_20435 [Vibrio ouci]